MDNVDVIKFISFWPNCPSDLYNQMLLEFMLPVSSIKSSVYNYFTQVVKESRNHPLFYKKKTGNYATYPPPNLHEFKDLSFSFSISSKVGFHVVQSLDCTPAGKFD